MARSLAVVWKPGSKVLVGGDIPAVVTQICIRGPSLAVQYLVAWWDGRRRISEWVDPEELTLRHAAYGETDDQLVVETVDDSE